MTQKMDGMGYKDTLGKALLMGQSWHGKIDLTDPVQYSRTRNYVAQRARKGA